MRNLQYAHNAETDVELGDDGEFFDSQAQVEKRKRSFRSRSENLSFPLRAFIVAITLLLAGVLLTLLALVVSVSRSTVSFDLRDLRPQVQYVPAPASSGQYAASVVDGLAVVVRGEDGLMYYKLSDDGSWTNWQYFQPLPVGASTDTPTLVAGKDGQLHLFVRGLDDAAWHASFNGTQWSAWESLEGKLTSGPAAVFSR